MTTFGLITWDHCKTILEMDEREKELTELLIFSASAEIEIYTETTRTYPETKLVDKCDILKILDRDRKQKKDKRQG